jgi:uncharacterized protein (DUF2147 family)
MSTRRLILSLVASAIPCLATAATSAHELEGVWNRGDGNTQVRIAPCGANLCATNTWVRNALTGEAVGDQLVLTLKKNGPGRYAGRAVQTRRGLTLTMTVTKVGEGRFSTSGCIAGSSDCRSTTWTAAR